MSYTSLLNCLISKNMDSRDLHLTPLILYGNPTIPQKLKFSFSIPSISISYPIFPHHNILSREIMSQE